MQKEMKYRTCPLCEAMCGLEIDVEENRATKIRGDKQDPFSRGHICPKAVAMIDIQEDPDRLKRPVKKTNEGWQEISWKQAFEEVGAKIKQLQKKYGDDVVGIYNGNPTIHNLGSTLFVPQFIKALKTKNRFSATSVDQLAHHLAAQYMFGHANLLPVPDIDRTQFWLILGGNPLVSNGSIMTAPDIGNRIKDILKRDGRIVVVDPRYTETAEKATEHLFIKPGTDVWLLLAMIQQLFENDWVNTVHLSDTILDEDIVEIGKAVKSFTPDEASKHTGIAAEKIKQLTRDFMSAKSAVCYGRLGVSTVAYGSLSQWAINTLNILSGNMDVPGGAMFPTPAFDSVGKKTARQKFGRWHSRVRKLPEFGGELPSATLAEEILTPGEGQIKAMITNCGNPVLSTPNGQQLDQAFESLDLMVSIDIYINETTRHADYILPPATGLEVPHFDIAFNNLAIRNTVKYTDPILDKDESAKYDYEIFQGLIRELQRDQLPDDQEARNQVEMMYAITPQMILDSYLQQGPYDLSVEKLRAHPHGLDLGPLQSHLSDRLITKNQKIDLFPDIFRDELKKLMLVTPTSNDKLSLIGRRQLRSNNSWMHNSHRLVKGPKRCTALIHPEDAADRSIRTGDEIRVSSRVGAVQIEAEVSEEIAKGVISIPHGWGHDRKGVKMKVAQDHAGVSINDLTDDQFVEELTGVTVLSGIPVDVELLRAYA